MKRGLMGTRFFCSRADDAGGREAWKRGVRGVAGPPIPKLDVEDAEAGERRGVRGGGRGNDWYVRLGASESESESSDHAEYGRESTSGSGSPHVARRFSSAVRRSKGSFLSGGAGAEWDLRCDQRGWGGSREGAWGVGGGCVSR